MIQPRLHCELTLATSLRGNRLNLRACLICPIAGSTICFPSRNRGQCPARLGLVGNQIDITRRVSDF